MLDAGFDIVDLINFRIDRGIGSQDSKQVCDLLFVDLFTHCVGEREGCFFVEIVSRAVRNSWETGSEGWLPPDMRI